jgi:hypothetical protein
MANYLQRVITAGERIQSSARPSAPAPAVLPQVLPAPFPEPGEWRTEAAGKAAEPVVVPATPPPVPKTPEQTRPAPRDQEQAIPAATVPPKTSAETGEAPKPRPPQQPVPLSVAIARLSSGVRIQAPKALRPRAPVPPGPVPTFLQPPKSAPRMAESSGPEKGVGSPKPEVVGGQGASPAAPTGAVAASVRPAQAPSPASEGSRGVTVQANAPRPPVAETKPAAPTRPSTPPVHDLAHTARPSGQRVAERPPERAPKSESSAAADARVIQALARPAAPPVPAMVVQERSNTRRSRISIGKVDVQVNNHRQQQTSFPARAAVSGARSDFLETRYLSRFPLRP